MGPSFHDPRTHYFIESHPERATQLSRRDERRHAVGSHSALALRLYLAACHLSSSRRGMGLGGLKAAREQKERARKENIEGGEKIERVESGTEKEKERTGGRERPRRR